jgi:hypothetical protein
MRGDVGGAWRATFEGRAVGNFFERSDEMLVWYAWVGICCLILNRMLRRVFVSTFSDKIERGREGEREREKGRKIRDTINMDQVINMEGENGVLMKIYISM